MADPDDPFDELERDRLLDLRMEAGWMLRVFRLLLVAASIVGAANLACMLLFGFDFAGQSALQWCSRASIFAIIIWLPMLVLGFALSARDGTHRATCYAIAIALFAIVVIGTPWLLANVM